MDVKADTGVGIKPVTVTGAEEAVAGWYNCLLTGETSSGSLSLVVMRNGLHAMVPRFELSGL